MQTFIKGVVLILIDMTLEQLIEIGQKAIDTNLEHDLRLHARFLHSIRRYNTILDMASDGISEKGMYDNLVKAIDRDVHFYGREILKNSHHDFVKLYK
jgi:hypothetical protein